MRRRTWSATPRCAGRRSAFDIRNTAVQGVNAVGEVIAALRELDANPDVEVIIIARGGGALEDLLPFSSEDLVRAVAACTTPVISAIGHEADRPILDDVADVRASTPTDAAKRVVPDLAEELANLAHGAQPRWTARCGAIVERETQRMAALRARPVLANPESMVAVRREDVVRLAQRSTLAMRALAGPRPRLRSRTCAPRSARCPRSRPWTAAMRSSSWTTARSCALPPPTPRPAAGIQVRLARGRLAATVTYSHTPEEGTNP